jgi:hypothetical protein
MLRLSDNEEQQAQSIACTHLVRGCEGAVSELALRNGEADGPSPAMDRARDILAQVLSSWRDVLDAVRPVEASAVTPVVGNLDRWTTAALFTEVVERSAADTQELRLMQDTILRALLAAHDAAIDGTAQARLVLN